MTFDEFYFDYSLMDGLDAMGFNKPTPIQELAIPAILDHKDLIACAQTGTGKTAAYVLPILNKIVESDHSHLNTLILVPTRELAMQIDQQVAGFSYYVPVSSISIYGGGDGAIWDQQKKALKHGADIIIATPGRLISLLATGDMNFDKLEHLVLDEADRMLDMGFYDDIIKIISYLPHDRQTLLFSATMPPKIRTLANKILYKPEEITIAISKPAEGILQQAYLTYDNQKIPLLGEIFKAQTFVSVIIFAGTKDKVKSLQFELKKIGLKAKSFHSDLEQKEREDLMNEFRNRKVQVLIGTDILSRGIDVDGIDLVVNFDVPPDPEDYVHRIGRTARAESKGTAITFINEKDQRRFHAIETLIEKEIPKLPLPASLGAGPTYSPNSSKRPPANKFFKPRFKK
ncbi:MAG: DEAD/DEAH box helicase [Bacteroidia bacterium]|nr:DEAD/DEAH box helicase [Bacteroidia bacterium]MCF8426168.1 DEAD/DEAH box helicase [Bacteroidia bacterium]MCF8445516.1 DEAD/DEAH box helicase [Bacteroidia bacterium]